MKRITRTLSIVSLAAAAVVGTTSVANAAEDVEQQILAEMPGLTKAQLESDLGISKADSATKDRIMRQVLTEVQAHKQEAQRSAAKAEQEARAAQAQEVTEVNLGVGRQQGDFFWSPAGWRFVKWNHVGPYYRTGKTAEAPGHNESTQILDARFRKVTQGAQKKSVYGMTDTQRLRAANWAGNHLNRPYNYDFAFNRQVEVTNYNCSQFVWAAYMSMVDLDNDGGLGVYPDDVKNSPLTRWYATV